MYKSIFTSPLFAVSLVWILLSASYGRVYMCHVLMAVCLYPPPAG